MIIKTDFKELGNYLKRKREQQSLTQGQVAEVLGYLSPQFVSNFERGLCTPPLEALRVLVELYKIPEKEIVRIIMRQQEQTIREELFSKKKRRTKAS